MSALLCFLNLTVTNICVIIGINKKSFNFSFEQEVFVVCTYNSLKKSFSLFIIFGFVILCLIGCMNKQLTGEEIFEKLSDSTVEITAESEYVSGIGSGFYIDNKGTVVTNYHVIENCSSAHVITSDGGIYDVINVLGYDKDLDIAILETTKKKSIAVEIEEKATTGETVYALGSSLGLTGTFSEGLVSSAERELGENVYIQISAPISVGNSGGPVVNGAGKVIGIACAGFEDGQNLNLAIPASEIEQIDVDSPVSMEEFFKNTSEYYVEETEYSYSDWVEEHNESTVEWLWVKDFLYYDDLSSYVLLFELSDENETAVSASGEVDICIINDEDVIVYNEKRHFTSENFEYWTNSEDGEIYVAAIYIDPDDIEAGNTEYGTVYVTAYGDTFSFEEASIYAFDLPTVSPIYQTTQSNNAYTYTCLSSYCTNEVIKIGDYCSEHRCGNDNCGSEREPNSQFCYFCQCNTAGCSNVKMTTGRYCIEHTCENYNCSYEKVLPSKYCSICLCGSAGCLNVKEINGYYCEEHVCTEPTCQFEKASDERFCSYHALTYATY